MKQDTKEAEDAGQAMFNRQLATYRKVVRENLMFHREVYGHLAEILADEAPKPFSFLDIACGDASASAAMLRGAGIGHYYGIDLSAASLKLAGETLTCLSCPVELHCDDFAAAMAGWSKPVDVAWIGMSLHHLQQPDKQRTMLDIRRALGGTGILLIWEPTYVEGETRAGWLDRFSTFRGHWASLTDAEFADMANHMRLADFPEAAEDWKAMGRRAGFARRG